MLAAPSLCTEVQEGIRREGGEMKHFRGLLFFHTAVGSLGVTQSIYIAAKETCFQGAHLLNNGCAMTGMANPRGSRGRAGASLQLGHVVQVIEKHLRADIMMP